MAPAFLPGEIEQRGEIVYYLRSRGLGCGPWGCATGMNLMPAAETGGVS